MKVLFLTNIPTPYQLDFIREVNKTNDMLAFFLWNTEPNRNWDLDTHKHIICRYRVGLKSYIRFYNKFAEFEPDIILAGSYNLPLSTLAFWLCRLYGKKMYFWLERPFMRAFPFSVLKKMWLHWKLHRADCILAIGTWAETFYKRFNKNICNFPYSMNLNKYYRIERLQSSNSDHIRFLFSGQLIPRKNIITLVKAFRQLDNRHITFTITGSGPLHNTVQNLIAGDERINLPGFVSPDELHTIYAENDVFILPSLYDGWAVVVAEAMAAGMPVIATDAVGAANEFVEHRKNGYICGKDIGSIQEALTFYIKHPELISEHGLANRETVHSSLADVKNAASFFNSFINQTKKIR